MTKATICLWYDHGARDAAEFYAAIFPNSHVSGAMLAPSDFPDGKQGEELTVEFTVLGLPCVGINGGTAFQQSEAFSFQIETADQAETDKYWNALVGNGGQESQCGWCKDRWGINWQVTPKRLLELNSDPDPARAKRTFEAMMKMKKIDIALLEQAAEGQTI